MLYKLGKQLIEIWGKLIKTKKSIAIGIYAAIAPFSLGKTKKNLLPY